MGQGTLMTSTYFPYSPHPIVAHPIGAAGVVRPVTAHGEPTKAVSGLGPARFYRRHDGVLSTRRCELQDKICKERGRGQRDTYQSVGTRVAQAAVPVVPKALTTATTPAREW